MCHIYFIHVLFIKSDTCQKDLSIGYSIPSVDLDVIYSSYILFNCSDGAILWLGVWLNVSSKVVCVLVVLFELLFLS